jgi:hypothetical protein
VTNYFSWKIKDEYVEPELEGVLLQLEPGAVVMKLDGKRKDRVSFSYRTIRGKIVMATGTVATLIHREFPSREKENIEIIAQALLGSDTVWLAAKHLDDAKGNHVSTT